MRSSIFTYLLAFSAGSIGANPIQAAGEPSDMTTRADTVFLDDRAGCQTIHTWSGGGCSALWGFGRCAGRCEDAAGAQGCCSGTVTSSVLANPGCVSGFKVCGCGCLTP